MVRPRRLNPVPFCCLPSVQGAGRGHDGLDTVGYVERREIDHKIKNIKDLTDDELRAIVEG